MANSDSTSGSPLSHSPAGKAGDIFIRLKSGHAEEAPRASNHLLTRWMFLRGLGIIYLIAFISFWVQMEGLIGSNGILPAGDFLQAVKDQTGLSRYWNLPTLCWFSSSDGFLHFLCFSGVVLSGLVVFNIIPGPALLLLWWIYLSLCSVGQVFLSYQWDILLLEAGFLAMFIAPWQSWPSFKTENPPNRIGVWLYRWLLFRLMFASGAVKLASGDPTWKNLTALQHHYETQPLPTWAGWYAHQLPDPVQTLSVVVMFGIELVLPFLIFFPQTIRLIPLVAFVLLQVLILVTGNYGFFNLLTLLLCLWLIDDARWRRWLPGWLLALTAERSPAPLNPKWQKWRRYGWMILGVLVVAVGGLRLIQQVFLSGPLPTPARQVVQWTAPLRSVNSYGLFAVMTTNRPEIMIEGSRDGEDWQAYVFKWKPDKVEEAPEFVAPHQPRLDWQMWFAALGDYRGNPWLIQFMKRLLEGSPEVLDLMESNPFPEDPPRFVRAVLYEYEFTDFPTLQDEGIWWERERKGLYCPPLREEMFRRGSDQRP